MKKIIMAVCSITLSFVAIISFIGCETIEGGKGLSVFPNDVTLVESNGVQSVRFTVGGTSTDSNGVTSVTGGAGELSVPFTWTVSNDKLGHITTVAGNQAIYISSGGRGINVVTVEDQYGAQGLATVTQP